MSQDDKDKKDNKWVSKLGNIGPFLKSEEQAIHLKASGAIDPRAKFYKADEAVLVELTKEEVESLSDLVYKFNEHRRKLGKGEFEVPLIANIPEEKKLLDKAAHIPHLKLKSFKPDLSESLQNKITFRRTKLIEAGALHVTPERYQRMKSFVQAHSDGVPFGEAKKRINRLGKM